MHQRLYWNNMHIIHCYHNSNHCLWLIFIPTQLMEVLDNEEISDVVTWLPHGKAFYILQKRRFANEVLVRYFKQSKFTSFTRKLNRWGFIRVTAGPEIGAYYHKNFQRGKHLLCMQMNCTSYTPVAKGSASVASTGSKKSSKRPSAEIASASSPLTSNYSRKDHVESPNNDTSRLDQVLRRQQQLLRESPDEKGLSDHTTSITNALAFDQVFDRQQQLLQSSKKHTKSSKNTSSPSRDYSSTQRYQPRNSPQPRNRVPQDFATHPDLISDKAQGLYEQSLALPSRQHHRLIIEQAMDALNSSRSRREYKAMDALNSSRGRREYKAMDALNSSRGRGEYNDYPSYAPRNAYPQESPITSTSRHLHSSMHAQLRQLEQTNRRVSDGLKADPVSSDSLSHREVAWLRNEVRIEFRQRNNGYPSSSPQFPEKLHAVLAIADDQGFGSDSHAVSWLPHGRTFVVHDEKVFMESIVPKFFRQTKIRSFYRQLGLWGFTRLITGTDAGAWYNENFSREAPNKIKEMVRTKIKSK